MTTLVKKRGKEVSEHFAERLNNLDDGCNEETERAKSSLTLTSNNTRARNQEMTSEAIDNNLSTITNTDLENQGVPILVLDDNNSHTVNSQTKNYEYRN
ncbi:35850_t:CDS:2 [Gigaspora margarita]|uniref:35850_t:CDS:1 n=1 Tax=Gigaspora margarita TaxID=4874 RepID=A0ABN7UGA5_GIGMA|nr:35850_t:CDS:2 [Gigaspora margarita]